VRLNADLRNRFVGDLRMELERFADDWRPEKIIDYEPQTGWRDSCN
jgi:hypothetical protein